MTKVKEVFSCTPFSDDQGSSVEHLLIIENLNKVKIIQEKMADELNPLKERQDLVTLHHKVLKEINMLIDTATGQMDAVEFKKVIDTIRGDLDLKMAGQLADLQEKLDSDKKIQDQIDALPGKFKSAYNFLDDTLKMADDIRKGATFYTKDQRDRLVDNLRMNMDDLNIQNDMQLQKVSRLNNETYESYQNARLMLKIIHDTFMTLIKNWKT